VIFVGTSGWQYRDWRGTFYPERLPQRRWLEFYVTRFPTVEINNTFYRLPREHVLLDWASRVPDTFTFAIKASQRITHFARLKPDASSATEFLLKNTSALGARLGPILFQLPPNLKVDVPRLRTFVATLPTDRRYTVEFRHESWFDDEVYAVLRERDIPLCVTEQPDFASPVVTTASWGYVRLHRLDYDAQLLDEWSRRIASQPWSEAFVYFKHDEGIGSGPPAVDAFIESFDKAPTA